MADLVERMIDAMYRAEAWSSFWSRDEAGKLVRACLAEIEAAGYQVVPQAKCIHDWRSVRYQGADYDVTFCAKCDAVAPKIDPAR